MYKKGAIVPLLNIMEDINKVLADKIFETANGKYSIFYEEEFFDIFPVGYTLNRQTLEKALNNLVSGGYVDVKYARGSVYCIAGVKRYVETPASAPLPPPLPIEQPTQTNKPQDKKTKLTLAVFCFLGSLLGAFMGGLIAFLIAFNIK